MRATVNMELFDFMSGESKEAKENRKIIEDTERKKTQLLNVVQNDINAIDAKIQGLYKQIGKFVYEVKIGKSTDEEAEANISECVEQIKGEEVNFMKLEEKKNSIEARYDEELELLRKFVPQVPQTVQSSTGNAFCTSCGAKREVNAAFCTNCGAKYE